MGNKNKFGSVKVSLYLYVIKITNMKNKIRQHLMNNPSYFKWSAERLAAKYGCSVRTMKMIVNELTSRKKEYLRSLNY